MPPYRLVSSGLFSGCGMRHFIFSHSFPYSAAEFSLTLVLGLAVSHGVVAKVRAAESTSSAVPMPERGICAHRGASGTFPENTIPAFREAIRLGVAMIELDVALTRDGHIVLLHDLTLDRTTDGTGPLAEQTLAELKTLDAGRWKAERFAGTQIPTLEETLAVMPRNLWLNVHLKGSADLAEKTAKTLKAQDRLHQAFLACDRAAAQAAQAVVPEIQTCNMQNQGNSLEYVEETIAMGAEFIQLYGGEQVAAAHVAMLRQAGVRINYFGTNDPERLRTLFGAGVQFPLVDQVNQLAPVGRELGISPLQPIYRAPEILPGLERPLSQLLKQHALDEGQATQGLALSPEHAYASTAKEILRFDRDWQLLDRREVLVDGVNHLGAIDFHAGALWAAMLHGPEGGKHDPTKNRTVVVKIDPGTLQVLESWDLTADIRWADPICFDGEAVWIGDLSDLGIHRYVFRDGQLVHSGVLRYPKSLHFSQGLRVVGDKLYSIHTFGEADGLFEFELPTTLDETIQRPTRVWQIAENAMHLEGFAFVPERPDEIWHAQGREVDRYRLAEIEMSPPTSDRPPR